MHEPVLHGPVPFWMPSGDQPATCPRHPNELVWQLPCVASIPLLHVGHDIRLATACLSGDILSCMKVDGMYSLLVEKGRQQRILALR